MTDIEVVKEPKPTLDELKKAYYEGCTALGELVYMNWVKSNEINSIFPKLQEFNQKAAELIQEQKTTDPLSGGGA